MICKNCKNEIDQDSLYCPYCGEEIKRCPICQSVLHKNARFCSQCGHQVNHEEINQEKTYEYNPVHNHQGVGGYYQPLNDHYYYEETYDHQDFKEIKTKKKVNVFIIVISVVALVISTVVSALYINSGDNSSLFLPNEQIKFEPIEIKGNNDEIALVGNVNQSGQVYLNDDLYVVNDQGKLVKMSRMLDQQVILIDEEVEYITIHQNTIYYASKDKTFNRCDLEGKNKEVLLNKAVYYVTIVGDLIYYQDDSDNESIHIYNMKTLEDKKLNDRRSYNLNIVNDMIYYTSEDGIYSMHLDGTLDTKLSSDSAYNLIYSDDYLYYYNSNQEIKCIDLLKQTSFTLIDEKSQLLNMNKNYMIYNSYNGVKVYDFKTNQSTIIYNGVVDYCFIAGDYLIMDENGVKVIMNVKGENIQRLFIDQQNDGNYV